MKNKFLFGKSEKAAAFLAKTGVLLALTIVVQYLSGLLKIQLLTGSLVNFFLFFSALSVGMIGGVVIGIVTPFLGFLLGFSQNIVLVPFIAVSNALLVVICAVLLIAFKVDFKQFKNAKTYLLSVATVVVSAAVKFLFLFLIALKLVLPLFMTNVPSPIQAAFGITQLFTALIGGAIFILVATLVKDADFI